MDELSNSFKRSIEFVLNGQKKSLVNPDPTVLLVDYLRLGDPGLTGTKLACGEGGCGACTVMLAHRHPRTGEMVSRAVNSCLRPLCTVDGCYITTVEGIGSTRTKLHPIQERIAACNGSQCGYCTPGFVMNMFSMLQETPTPSAQQIEDRFDGNLCRCTGYRSILNAMQSFADSGIPLVPVIDQAETQILHETVPLKTSGSGYQYFRPTTLHDALMLLGRFQNTGSNVKLMNGNTSIGIYKRDVYDPKIWIDVSRVPEIMELRESDQDETQHCSSGLVIGGGVTFAELLDFLETLISRKNPSLVKGLTALRSHVARIANTQVRGVATVGGNIMLAKNHQHAGLPFPSDFVTVAGTLAAWVALRTPEKLGQDILAPLMNIPHHVLSKGALITKVIIPFSQPDSFIRTYKVARRIQNSHAIVNAGFNCRLNDSGHVLDATIVVGNISSFALGALRTAEYLRNRPWNRKTFQGALQILRNEMRQAIVALPDDGVSQEFRLALVDSLFYKFFLDVAITVAPEEVSAIERSAAQTYVRPISTGTNDFVEAPYYDGEDLQSRVSQVSTQPGTRAFAESTMKRAVSALHEEAYQITAPAVVISETQSPPNKPIGKVSANIQATGEAKYTQDLTGPASTLHAAYVYSECSNALFDYGEAGLPALVSELRGEFPGFRGYFEANDIPYPDANLDIYNDSDPGAYDPIFARSRITAYGQPIGLVIAQTLNVAELIARKLQSRIRYDSGSLRPIKTIEEAVAEPNGRGLLSKPPKSYIPLITRPDSDSTWLANPAEEKDRTFVTGTQLTGAQAHFYMETQATLAVPEEMGRIVLYASAQNLASCQGKVAKALGIPENKVESKVTRLGGGYGGKEVRPPFIAAAVAIAAWKMNAPVRLALNRNTDMIMIGKRHPFKGTYYLSADRSGKIEKARFDFWSNAGFSYDCSLPVMDLVLLSADGCYNVETFEARGLACRTNMETRTAMRSFGFIQCSLITEEAIEHLAHELGMLPEEVREANFYRDATIDSWDETPYGQQLRDCRIGQVWDDMKKKSDFENRVNGVRDFNNRNRWRKRGLSMIPIKYGVSYTFVPMNQGSAYVMVYQDGSVVVHHGGVEMGQGLDTKIARITADFLGIDMKQIMVERSDTTTIPNASSTGASTGADLNGGAVRLAAEDLRKRLEKFCEDDGPTIPKFPPDWRTNWKTIWPKIISFAYGARIDLCGQATFASPHLEQLSAKNNYHLDAGEQVFFYFTYSVAVSEVEIDVLTGEFSIIRSDIIYDAGQTLNSELDIGQVQGGFVQGVGNVTTEEIYYADDGRLISYGTWNYKPPCSKTIPIEFNVSLLEYVRTSSRTNTPMDHYGIQSSKSTGEPPLVLSNTVFFAIKHAIAAARADMGHNEWFDLESPATVERIKLSCAPDDAFCAAS
jgi:xanthine dehydrogenase/oxidase